MRNLDFCCFQIMLIILVLNIETKNYQHHLENDEHIRQRDPNDKKLRQEHLG